MSLNWSDQCERAWIVMRQRQTNATSKPQQQAAEEAQEEEEVAAQVPDPHGTLVLPQEAVAAHRVATALYSGYLRWVAQLRRHTDPTQEDDARDDAGAGQHYGGHV